MVKQIKSVAVYCGHKLGKNHEYAITAQKIGEILAKNNITVVFGGSNVGLMGMVSSAALENGGNVIGISTPHVESLQEPAHPEIKVKIVDGLSTRKQEMYDLSDAFIILPGGMGTLDEMTDILTKQQVGESCKPVILVDTANFWESFDKLVLKMIDEDFTPYPNTYNLYVIKEAEEIIDILINNNDLVSEC